MSLAFDEYGRPFIIVKEGASKGRVKGIAAQKANILAAKAVCNILRTSLGPKGMDKMLQSPDGVPPAGSERPCGCALSPPSPSVAC